MTGTADTRVVIIGGGAMGGAIAQGLAASGWTQVSVVEAVAERRAQLAANAALQVTDDPAAVVPGARVVVLLVKPKDAPAALDQLRAHLAPDAVLVSMCAGVPIARVAEHLPAGTPIVRVMPNTPAQVGAGMAVLSSAPGVADDDRPWPSNWSVRWVPIVLPETMQDAATALSGSGPAYIFYVAEAMIEAGVQLGLTRDQASLLVNQTILGAGQLLVAGEHPSVLRERVTSPGGTTAAALRELDAHAVRAAFADAVWAAHDRSRG